MNKLKMHKNDQPSKREREHRLMVRKGYTRGSQVLGYNWLPALNKRWKTLSRELKRMRRNTKEEISQ